MQNTLSNPIFYIFLFNIVCIISIGIYYYRAFKIVRDILMSNDALTTEIVQQLMVLRTKVLQNTVTLEDIDKSISLLNNDIHVINNHIKDKGE